MTKIEERMKRMIEENYTDEIAGVVVAKLIEGKITLEKQDEFVVVFKDTGFRRRGDIFSRSEFAPYFDDLFLQMFPARFDMILRVAGSVLAKRLNILGMGLIERLEVCVTHGIGVNDNLPISCPYISVKFYGHDGPEMIGEELYETIAEVIAENLDLLTDTFLRELREIAEKME